MYGEYVGT